MTRRLIISPELSLPLDAVTETFAILAVRGAGKSNAGVVMAEEMYKAGLPWVAIDPKGDWWGIRSSSDGKSPGLPVALFGATGRKRKNKPAPDVPLEDTAGKLIADLIVDERLPAILDMSAFSEAAKVRFLIDFGTQLFERNEEPLHLFLEEADDYIPQKPFREQTRLVHLYTKILKQARTFGIGASLISQRSAVVNKNALTQAGTLIAMRTTSPQDRAAIKGWVKEKGGQHVDIIESLPSLESGEAWVWSPDFLKKVERIRFRRRETFDSGATPKVGAKVSQPKSVADIDLAAVQERMAETIERAKAHDPKELQRKVAQLQKELASRPREKEVVEKQVEVMVPVLKPGDVEEIKRLVAPALNGLSKSIDETRQVLIRLEQLAQPAGTPRPQRTSLSSSPPKTVAKAQPARAATSGAAEDDGKELNLKAGARRILETMARHYPMRVTRAQLGTLSGFKITGGTFQTYFGLLKRHGLIVEEGREISVTDAGLAYIGEAPADPMTTEEILEQWRKALKAGARAMLDVLVEMYPDSTTREDLAASVEMTPSGGTFQTYLGMLRRNGLVEIEGSVVRASDTLFLTPATA